MKRDNPHHLIYDSNEIVKTAECLYSLKDQCDIYVFQGSLGAGKTTLVRELLRCYGVTSRMITSPTFTYMQQYGVGSGVTLYHFDLYRLATLQDFVYAGFDEYLYRNNSWCFIEWPEIIEPLLSKRVCHVLLEYYNIEQRSMTWYLQ